MLDDRAVESFRRDANPDFFHIAPRGPSAIIGVPQITPGVKKPGDDTLPLTDFIRVAPLYSTNKVIWIEDAHRMNISAANSLLKTLEEPPSAVKIILTTSQISQIPATILSRCLVVNCELPTPEDLRQAYPNVSSDLLAVSEGSPGIIERIVANPDLYNDMIRFADRVVTSTRHHALILGEEFRKLSERLDDQEKLGARNTNARLLEIVATCISKRHPHRSDAVMTLSEAHRRVLGNANPGLVLDSALGKILLSNN